MKFSYNWIKELSWTEKMSEKNIVVNENDNVIDYKERKLIKATDIYRISALWVINSQQQILLARRNVNKDKDPGKLGPAVSGTVAKDESYLENITKETKEEIGIDLENCSFKEIEKIYTKEKHQFFCQWYFLKADINIDDLVVQEDEVGEVFWMNKDEFEKDLRSHPEKYTISMSQHYNILKKY